MYARPLQWDERTGRGLHKCGSKVEVFVKRWIVQCGWFGSGYLVPRAHKHDQASRCVLYLWKYRGEVPVALQYRLGRRGLLGLGDDQPMPSFALPCSLHATFFVPFFGQQDVSGINTSFQMFAHEPRFVTCYFWCCR